MLSLIIKFCKERIAANPSREFRLALREKIRATLPPETRTEHRYAMFRRAAVGFAIMLPVLFGGTSAYAYSSPSVTEGSVLYPVKRGIESVQLRFRTAPDVQATYRLELYERRLDEAERLFESREAMIQTLNAAVEVNDALESSEYFPEGRGEMRERLQRNQDRYEMVRRRVYMEDPSGEFPLRTPSFMIRRMQY
jgi:hypothetical protein